MTVIKKMVITAVALLCFCAGGCSKASSMTCDQYAAKSDKDQFLTVMNMIKEHGFDPYSNGGGTVDIFVKVGVFCGIGSDSSTAAGQNGSSSIEEAIDWSTIGK